MGDRQFSKDGDFLDRDGLTCEANPSPHTCAWSGCGEAAEYRAPKDRTLTDYQMFCLEHVRTYNAQWNFHAGLSTAEMEQELRSSATWDRPTWKLGSLGARMRPGHMGGRMHVEDPFGFAEGTEFDPRRRERAREKRDEASPAGKARSKALKVLDLTLPLTLDALRRRYKTLVKKYHPDANGGSAEAESRMKVINEAYQTLKADLSLQEG